ncbi:hypothetical protein FB451DRAFT_622984 [Mycena latifolia]|nr:hypothetical protein FB451DRAFT_622984 [Mycena latifolia]
MAVVDANAVLLIATWLCMSLYALELILAAKYLQRPSRPLWHKLGIAVLVLTETINITTICAQAYIVLLVFGCDRPQFIPDIVKPVTANITVTYTTAAAVQSFMCYLFYYLTKKRIITGCLLLAILVEFGFAWASSGSIFQARTLTHMSSLDLKITAIACVVIDFLLAAALGHTLYKNESYFAARRSTFRLTRRLMVLSLTSGFITALSATLSMIRLLQSGPGVFILFFFIQGRIYGITTLSNLLLGIPDKPRPTQTNINAGSRQDATAGAVFHLDYHTSSDGDTSRPPESINLQPLQVKAHND